MTAAAAYSSGEPVVIDAWLEAEEQVAIWNHKVQRLRDQFPDHAVMVAMSGWDQGRRVSGLRGEQKIDGCRWDKKHDQWVPDMRTKAGRQLQLMFNDLVLKAPRLPGMPEAVMSGNSLYKPGYLFRDLTVWVTWGCAPGKVESSTWSSTTLDQELWTLRKLSEYYAQEEAADDEDVSSSTPA